jgi:colanic acid biosynthesis glycosyl transferase WcaI
MSLRIHLHDNSGHAFPVQLSRALAALGHNVRHTYMASFQSPKGQLARQPDDPPSLQIEGLSLDGAFPKYSYWRRWRYERRFGKLLAAQIEQQRPDVLLVCNTPLDVLDVLQRTCKRNGIRLVFWVQDLYGYAVAKILGQRYGRPGQWVGRYY